MEKKTLYVSDLDGTLLTSGQTLSDYTLKTVNSLAEKGLLFSYATARSYATSSIVAKGLYDALPVIVYNGTFILENGSKKRLYENYFSKSDAREILDILHENGVHPIVYAYINGEEKFSYVPHESTDAFLNTRRGDGRDTPTDEEHLLLGDVFHFSCIDSPEHLYPAYQKLLSRYPCVYYKEQYSGDMWLEIHPVGVTKANAVKKLKDMLGCDRIVCFGDGKNDIPMFEISDECYATENAAEELKMIATAVIESNDNDGVAKWLAANTK